jgi:hypothetical protein
MTDDMLMALAHRGARDPGSHRGADAGAGPPASVHRRRRGHPERPVDSRVNASPCPPQAARAGSHECGEPTTDQRAHEGVLGGAEEAGREETVEKGGEGIVTPPRSIVTRAARAAASQRPTRSAPSLALRGPRSR